MLPRIARRWQADVLLSFGSFVPLRSPCPTVLEAGNALQFTRAYWQVLGDESVRVQLEEQARWRLLRASLRAATRVLTPTRAMRQDVVTSLPELMTRVDVALWGVAPVFRAPDVRWHDSQSDVILGVSKHGINKEFDVLVAALPHVRRRWPGMRLVLTGFAERVALVTPQCGAGRPARRGRTRVLRRGRAQYPGADADSAGAPAGLSDLVRVVRLAAGRGTGDGRAGRGRRHPGLPRGGRGRGPLLRNRRSSVDGRRVSAACSASPEATDALARTRIRARQRLPVARQRDRCARHAAAGRRVSVPVSVLIPTLDEELNLADCLASVDWADEIFVVDSFSHDGTLETARAAGANVVQHAFEGYSRQKNWALDNLPFRNEWVLIVDADERVMPDLRCEIERVLSRRRRRAGRLLPESALHLSQYVDPPCRLVSELESAPVQAPTRPRYDNRDVHEHLVLNGRAGYLQERTCCTTICAGSKPTWRATIAIRPSKLRRGARRSATHPTGHDCRWTCWPLRCSRSASSASGSGRAFPPSRWPCSRTCTCFGWAFATDGLAWRCVCSMPTRSSWSA